MWIKQGNNSSKYTLNKFMYNVLEMYISVASLIPNLQRRNSFHTWDQWRSVAQ
jgi:hypothetical protein